MKYGKLSCKHGSLARSCETCELTEENIRLKALGHEHLVTTTAYAAKIWELKKENMELKELSKEKSLLLQKYQAKVEKLQVVASATEAYFSQDRSKATVGDMLRIDADLAMALVALKEKL